MTMRDLPLGEVYRLIEPGPVVLLATAHKGRPNLMAMSWHMMMEFEPPLIACLVSGNDFSFAALDKTGECTVAIPGAELARTVVKIGNCTGRTVDKFAKFRLTPLPAARVRAPLVAECVANLECRVVDRRFVDRYNLFVLEVVKAWRDPKRRDYRAIHHRGRGWFTADGKPFRLPSAKA